MTDPENEWPCTECGSPRSSDYHYEGGGSLTNSASHYYQPHPAEQEVGRLRAENVRLLGEITRLKERVFEAEKGELDLMDRKRVLEELLGTYQSSTSADNPDAPNPSGEGGGAGHRARATVDSPPATSEAGDNGCPKCREGAPHTTHYDSEAEDPPKWCGECSDRVAPHWFKLITVRGRRKTVQSFRPPEDHKQSPEEWRKCPGPARKEEK